MSDPRYLFQQDCREKASAARGMYAKKNHSKGCKLPSDNLTKKEKEKLNGPTQTYRFSEPVRYDAFTAMPLHIQEEYVNKLFKEYEARDCDIADMLGITRSAWSTYKRKHFPSLLKKRDVEYVRSSAEISMKWIDFMGGVENLMAQSRERAEADAKKAKAKSAQSKKVSKPATAKPKKEMASVVSTAETVAVATATEQKPVIEGMAAVAEIFESAQADVQKATDIVSGSLNLTGYPGEIFRTVMALLDSKKSYKISVSFEG